MKHSHLIILFLLGVLPVCTARAQAVDMLVTSPGLQITPGSNANTADMEFTLLSELGSHIIRSDSQPPGFTKVTVTLSSLDGTGILPSGTGAALFNWSYDPATKTIRGISTDAVVREDSLYKIRFENLPVTSSAESAKIGFKVLLIPPADLLNSETSDDSLAFYLDSPLALAFTAERQSRIAVLNTSTAPGISAGQADVERSTDGRNWSTIGKIYLHSGKGVETSSDFKDLQPVKGENRYRLKTIGPGGKAKYSLERKVIFDEYITERLYPNPLKAGEKLNLFSSDLTQITQVEIFDVSGKRVYQSKAVRQIDTSNLSAGSYLVQLGYTDGTTATLRFIKQ